MDLYRTIYNNCHGCNTPSSLVMHFTIRKRVDTDPRVGRPTEVGRIPGQADPTPGKADPQGAGKLPLGR